MKLANGTLLHGGTYKIMSVLGQGSFGITYLAEHTSLGRKVCIKEFFMKELNSRCDDGSITGLSDGSLSYNYAQKFRKEAQNLARMEHPNIVRVTDSFDENGTFYYVMEYIDGQNLNEYVKNQAVSESEAISIIKDVANALIYMHEDKHMLHLDLKPGNIMRRSSDGHIFLIDFGLSKHYSNDGQPETSTTIGLGTAGYAPIEQANQAKNGEFRPTIDVYALGATLFKLLTRETPPAASEVVNDDEILVEKLHNKAVSQNIIDLIVKAMEPGYKKRFQTMRELMSFLNNITTSAINTNTLQECNNEETIVTPSHNTMGIHADVDKKDSSSDSHNENKSSLPETFDKDQLAYNIAELILNEGYDRDLAITHLSQKEDVPESIIPEIIDEAEVLVRQSNKEAGKKDIIQGLVLIAFSVALETFTGLIAGGVAIWGLYKLCRGCKSYFTGYTYGQSTNNNKWFVLAGIVIVVCVLGYLKLNGNSYQDDFITAFKQLNGYGIEKNTTEGVKKLQELANDNYGPAAYVLGYSYYNGLFGLEKDSVEAERYLKIAYDRLTKEADDGDKCAQSYLGYMYMRGIYVQQDQKTAEKYLLQSAKQDYEVGQYFLGNYYLNNNRTSDGFNWIEKASSQNYPPATYHLSMLYAQGIGTAQDSSKYASLLNKAAELNSDDAKVLLGYNHMVGNSYIAKNPTIGLQLLEKADSEGRIDAALDLGWCYLKGIGVIQNTNKAIEYAQKIASTYHDANSALLLGYCYDTQSDYTTAMQWYAIAANENNPNAQYQMAIHYRDGLGVEANQDYADNWYRKAVANGYKE